MFGQGRNAFSEGGASVRVHRSGAAGNRDGKTAEQNESCGLSYVISPFGRAKPSTLPHTRRL